MSLLKNLTTSKDIAEDKDVLGGMSLRESGVYSFNITMAYLQKSEGGALGLFLTMKDADGQEFKNTQYLTGGNDKGNQNFYEKDGQKHYLPGFNLANSLALLTIGKEVSDLDTDTKVVNVYDFKAKTEVPTKVEVITDLIGAEINVGILRTTEDKRAKNEATNKYEPTGESVDRNEIDKFFCAKEKYLNMTATEIKAKIEKAVFVDQWKEKNDGKTRDKRSKGGGTAGAPAKTGGAAGTGKPSSSLFSADE